MAMPVSFARGAPRRPCRHSFAARTEKLNRHSQIPGVFESGERAFDRLRQQQIAVAAKPPSSKRSASEPLPENGQTVARPLAAARRQFPTEPLPIGLQEILSTIDITKKFPRRITSFATVADARPVIDEQGSAGVGGCASAVRGRWSFEQAYLVGLTDQVQFRWASCALEVYAAHPDRFRLVKPVDPTDPAVVDTIADWAATKGTVGIRVFLRDNVSTDPADPAINRVLATAAQHSLPVNLACTGRPDQARHLAARNPNTRLVIDHLGLPQPHEPPPPAEPFADLPKLLALAAHDNVAVKISGACTLSHEAFPLQRPVGSARPHL
jgi:hypothetical protein